MKIILITLFLIVNLSHALFAKIASVIGNPISQEIYFEVNKDTKNYPASLTKLMTLYIIFDELRAKNISLYGFNSKDFDGKNYKKLIKLEKNNQLNKDLIKPQ